MLIGKPRNRTFVYELALRRLIESTLETRDLPQQDEAFLRNVLSRTRINRNELSHIFRIYRLLDAANDIAMSHRALAGRILSDPAADTLAIEHRGALFAAIDCMRFEREHAAMVVKAANAFNQLLGRPILICFGRSA